MNNNYTDSSLDTITITSAIDYATSSIGTTTIGNSLTLGDSYSSASAPVTTITFPTGGNSYSYNTGSTGYNWATPQQPNVNITSTGIDMAAGTDITVDGKSLKEFMTKMEQRLAILVPDPTKLEKFQALKKAYEHYKTMESLCFDEPENDQSN